MSGNASNTIQKHIKISQNPLQSTKKMPHPPAKRMARISQLSKTGTNAMTPAGSLSSSTASKNSPTISQSVSRRSRLTWRHSGSAQRQPAAPRTPAWKISTQYKERIQLVHPVKPTRVRQSGSQCPPRLTSRRGTSKK